MGVLFCIINISMKHLSGWLNKQNGFSAVEFLVAAVVFGILTTGILATYLSVQNSYNVAKQLNEMYTVLSACPEIDRAIEYNSVDDSANCSPNNVFGTENDAGGKRTYTPVLTVKYTADPGLPVSEPLKTYQDSKIVDVKVGFYKSSKKPMELRMLITRNGVGQQ